MTLDTLDTGSFLNGHLDRPSNTHRYYREDLDSYPRIDFVKVNRSISLSRMVSSGRVAILIFGVALLVTSGSALQCWVCSSNVNLMCNDPMNTTDHQAVFHITTCDPGHYSSLKPICRKIVKREHGERIVIRQCSVPYHDEIDIVDGLCGSSMTQQGRDESCHICSTDLCNSATTASTMRLLHAGVPILLAYIFHQFKYCVL